ncbi:arylsulfatase B-like [Ptychodera flava]|uniref:arylsulfatase B-like n=1 Tax=Ptychodera flava TaxID=63121 RepID=UPI00396A152E
MKLLIVMLAGFALVQSEKPNIIFVVADDLGWNDIGYNNHDIITPTLDTLAREGVILNQSYVLPMCTPTRTAFMSGYYPYRVGLQHKVLTAREPAGLPLNFTLLPKKLKEQGYTTYMVGKWHLGFCKWDYTPNARGFDHFYGYYNGLEDYYTHEVEAYLDLREDKVPDWKRNGTYSSYVFTEKAEEYIAKHDKTKPMYMYLSFQSVHGPIQVPQRYLDMYPTIQDTNRRIKSGMITAMDDAVKHVVTALQKHGLWNNTLFIFTTDNGGPAEADVAGNNWPLRGSKTTLWEGGTRGVAFVHGNILQKTAYVNEEMIHAVDWYPTLLELIGGKQDPDMDVNVWETISKAMPSPRTEFVYNIDEVDHPGAAIRVGDFKLITGKAGNPDGWIPVPKADGAWEEIFFLDEHEGSMASRPAPWNATYLFNIKDDPTEHHNLAEEMPDKVKQLNARLEELKKKLVPAIRPDPDHEKSDPRRFGGAWSPGWC